MTRVSVPLVFCLSVLVALGTFRFIPMGRDAFDGTGAFRAGLGDVLLVHAICGSIALAVGGLQFFPRLRASRPALHRWLGRSYVALVAASGLAGLFIAPNVPGGAVSAIGFGLLAVLWLGTTAAAFQHARARRIADHRRWMIRSFALTFAAVTLRLYLPAFFIAGSSYDAAAPWLAWLCWVPNLVVAELIIRRQPA